mgnify:CR=1 FL=1
MKDIICHVSRNVRTFVAPIEEMQVAKPDTDGSSSEDSEDEIVRGEI